MKHPFALLLAAALMASVTADDQSGEEPAAPQEAGSEPPPFPGRPERGGFPGMMRQKTPLVAQFDKDGNGRLGAAERKAAREFLEKGGGAGRGPGGRGGFGPGRFMAPAFVSEADKDGDREVNRAEFTALAEAWYGKLDTDQAGRLGAQEFSQRLDDVLPRPPGFRGPLGSPRPRGPGPSPGRFVGPGLFTRLDVDQDGWLRKAELTRTFQTWFGDWDSDESDSLDEEEVLRGLDAVLPRPDFGGPRRRGFPGRRQETEPPQPGVELSPADVEAIPDAPLYTLEALRTLFLEFESADWERELAAFKNTDVEVPARLTVDGKTYLDVGVHFRGMSSFMMVGEGRKRSLNLSLDFVHTEQRLNGYRTLNLLNSHGDPTFLRAVLYSRIASRYLPALRTNFVRVVINGENWGVYVNAQQFNKDFLKEWYGTKKGVRWKVPGSPGGRGGLVYLGDDVDRYRSSYELKSKENPERAWADLIKLMKVLCTTPVEQLEAALAPLLDIDGALKFLALENALINDDGYWIRSSDYNMYQDPAGRFHILPYDTNETFTLPGGPGFGRRGRGERRRGGRLSGGGLGRPEFGDLRSGNGLELDPLIAANDPDKPLASKLLAVPALRKRYLLYIRDIADNWLDWDKLGPMAQRYHALIAADVKDDTRKLDSTEAFEAGLAGSLQGEGSRWPARRAISLKEFATQRRAYLLKYTEAAMTSSSDEGEGKPQNGAPAEQ